MRTFQKVFALSLGLAGVLPGSAPAATVSLSDFPATVQSCWGSGCFVPFTSGYDSGSVAAWTMFDLAGQLGQQTWLIRYELAPPSGSDSLSTGFTPYGGYLWMQVQKSYNAADPSHAVTLFMDHVTPKPESLNYFDTTPDLHLFVTSEDLIAGRAYAFYADPGYGDEPAGGLSGDLPLICLAEGCETRALLNLVQLTYAASGPSISMSGFDAGDMRSLVFSQGRYYADSSSGVDPSGVTQSFHIPPVPEPEPSWLMGASLLAVLIASRRRRQAECGRRPSVGVAARILLGLTSAART